MTVCELLKYVRFIANKSQKGNAYTPSDYNYSLQNNNIQIFNDELAKFTPGAPIPELLRTFHTEITSGTLATGVYTLPADFAELATLSFTCTVGGVKKFGEFVSDTEAKKRRMYTQYKLAENPIAVMRSGTIQVYPTNAAGFGFEYLKQPATPVYDYYIDSNLNEVCLAVGQAYTINDPPTTGEVASDGSTSGIYASKTVEIEWDEEAHPRFAALILRDLGINVREGEIVQIAEGIKNQTR